jgi:hypothetical protein
MIEAFFFSFSSATDWEYSLPKPIFFPFNRKINNFMIEKTHIFQQDREIVLERIRKNRMNTIGSSSFVLRNNVQHYGRYFQSSRRLGMRGKTIF